MSVATPLKKGCAKFVLKKFTKPSIVIESIDLLESVQAFVYTTKREIICYTEHF